MSEIGAAKGLLDDTPVNGEIGKGITSNWAFDEDVTLRALIEATLTWWITIDVIPAPKSNVNWDTYNLNASCAYFGYRSPSGLQNDEIAWDIVLAKGTWNIEIISSNNTGDGIISVQFDDVQKGTIDMYAASLTYNISQSIIGIVVPLTKKIELKLKATTKNPLSSGYYARLQSIRLIRTA